MELPLPNPVPEFVTRTGLEIVVEDVLWKLVRRLKHRCRIIEDDDGSPYLLRCYLTPMTEQRWWPGVFLHYFYRGDHDREVHNHPWDVSMSLILTGGYIEERFDAETRGIVERVIKPLMLNVIRGDDFHRVQMRKGGCFSLFIAGRKIQRWGFLRRDGTEFEDAEERYERIFREKGAVTKLPTVVD